MILKLIAYFILQSIYFIGYSFECGIIVHNEVSYRSLQLFRPLNEVEFKYKNLLSSLPSFMQAGSYFPDWGYNCLGYHEQSEAVHWAPFIKTAINYIRDTYPQPWTDLHVKGLIVFIFSIMSHDIADVKWHSLNHLEDYFIQAMSQLDFDGDFQMAHTVADTGAEFVLRHSTNIDYLNQTWQIPINDIIQIYTRYYDSIDKPQPIPSKDHIRYCMTGAFAGFKLELDPSIGNYMHSYFGSKSPFLVDQLNDYHKGGLQDLSASVSHCYRDIIKSIENGVVDTLCGNYFDDQESKEIYNNIKYHHYQHKRDVLPLYNTTITITNDNELKLVEQKYGIISKWDEINGILTIKLKEPLQKYSTSFENNNDNTQLFEESMSPIQQPLITSKNRQCSPWKQNNNDVSSFSLASSLVGFGHATVSGDFNGDGKTDIAISAPYYTEDEKDSYKNTDEPSLMTGAVFILNGNQPIWQQQQLDIRNLSATILKGKHDGERFGTAMAVADMNRDGIDDLIVSSPFANGLIGSISIYFGGMDGLSNKPNIQFTSSHGSNGIEGFGYSLFSIDIDQDGYNDLAVGCPYCKVDSKSQAGLVEIYTSKYFSTETKLNNQEHWTLFSDSPTSYERFGTSVTITNSVLNDHTKNVNDNSSNSNSNQAEKSASTLVIGAPGTKINGLSQAGKVYGFDLKSIQKPTLKWFINGSKKFGQFGSIVQSWKDDILVITSPTEDTLNGLQKHWQGGSIRIYDWKTLNRGKNGLSVNYGLIGNLKGQLSSGHFGSSISFFMNNNNNKDIGLWIGEPLGHHENGRIYKWMSSTNDLECLSNDVNMARFGARVINIGPNAICITSLYDSQSARSSGMIHLYKS
ncbi:hypothetical protein BJ944DRAFT_260770 [Cunninghamella echinulata]|nr:hypothetical protein BJ944DRAFT_260770 [Cunninghamella echinulata]